MYSWFVHASKLNVKFPISLEAVGFSSGSKLRYYALNYLSIKWCLESSQVLPPPKKKKMTENEKIGKLYDN